MRSLHLLTSVAVLLAVFTVTSGQAFAAGDTYRDVVLADSPVAYYEFEEAVGATVAIDSSPNGNDSLFLGSRSVKSPVQPGFFEAAGLNVNFGTAGRAGNSVQILNSYDDDWANATDTTLCGPFIGDCEAYRGGGYIRTGVTLKLDGTSDWSIEVSVKNDNQTLLVNEPFGERALGPTIVSQPTATEGVSDVYLLAQTDQLGDGDKNNADNYTYTSSFGKGHSYAKNIAGLTPGNPFAVEDQWETIVLSYDASEVMTRWYLEGQLIREVATVSDNDWSPPQDGVPDFEPNNVDPWYLGLHPDFSPRLQFSGWIDEFSVYDYRLDDPDGDGDMSDSRVDEHFAALTAFTGLLADFDDDNDVDGNDFLEWQQRFGTDLDATDLANWKNEYGSVAAATAAASAVPEPSTGILLLAAVGLLVPTGKSRGCPTGRCPMR